MNRRTFAASMAALVPATVAGQATPDTSPVDGSAPVIVLAPGVERYVWPVNAEPLPTTRGEVSGFAPASVTLVNHNDVVHVGAELRNVSGSARPAPTLIITAWFQGKSFGEQEVGREYPWVEAGSVSLSSPGYREIYGGSVLVGDWDELTFQVRPSSYRPDSPMDTSGIRVEDGKVYNDGAEDVEWLSFYSVVRDGSDVFVGTCWVSIDAVIPAGLFVRLPQPLDDETGFACFLPAGPELTVVEALETSPIRTDKWVPVRWVT